MGTVQDQYALLRQSAGLVDLSAREQLRVTGEDRVSFIHGMVTQDITGLPEGAWAYAALCTAKGAMVADARVIKLATEVLLDTEPGYGARLNEHLQKFLISENAEIVDVSSERAVLAVIGPSSAEAVKKLGLPVPEGTQVVEAEGTLVLGHGLYGVPAYELFVSRGRAAEVKQKLALPEIGAEAFELLRVEAGVGRMGVDMEETTIPLEANLERGISYNKGCYIGQEVIARATFRGAVNKKLMGLKFDAALPARGAELRKNGKVIGRVTSVVESPTHGKIGLGYVHRTLLDAGTELEVADQAKATVVALPFK